MKIKQKNEYYHSINGTSSQEISNQPSNIATGSVIDELIDQNNQGNSKLAENLKGDIQLILKLINPSTKRNDIIKMLRSNYENGLQSIIYYTDGSVKDIGMLDASSTAAVIQISEKEMDINQEIVVTYEHWHNSTQAEIVAIIIALLTAPSLSHVTLYSDSLNAIRVLDEIQNDCLDSIIHPRKYFKISSNNIFWLYIKDILKHKKLDLSLIKVKAHSEDICNDYVDNLAKSAHWKQDYDISFNHNATKEIKIKLM